MNIVKKAKDSANKRSVDAYGKAVELAITTYLLDNGDYPTSLDNITVEYTGNEVVCNVKTLNEDGSIYLSECSVKGTEVKDSSTEDGWYYYGEERVSPELAVTKILRKTNNENVTTYTNGTVESHQMYTFNHEATIQTGALTDYRYIGSDPYNYVMFNDELWRIIGVFSVEDENGNLEQRIKIIKNKSIGEHAWEPNNINEWSTASLQIYLNGEYYNSLSKTAQEMIGKTKYYLGGSTSAAHSAISYYGFERGETVYSGHSTYFTEK